MRVTIDQFNEFRAAYDAGEHPHQRFGQAFMNVLLPKETVHPELFYAEDRGKAVAIIWSDYVEVE